ncbi:putative leucine-rich repeat-containing protein DDB_G0290503 [Mytilus edulis]|uniref:putative leucine-rich repeat-containing protein DDB_G0290503 n=1 Tax=Mytilus edulis TaxID=6550 RepID=UPI0039EF01D2
MNSVLIPDIYRLMSGPYHSIASFTTLCEELEDHIDPTIDEVRMEKMISIMKRLRDYKTDEVFPKMNELFYMLTETVFSLVESQENWSLSESDKPSVARMILDKFQKMIVGGRILPQRTLTEKKCHKRYKQVREYKEVQDLEKLIENHEKIYQELQEQQKKCKVINDKVTFVTDLLQRKKTFFAEYEDKFSPKNHERRKDYIKFLQEKLERNMEKAAETTGKYQTLLYAESVANDKVRQLESQILDSLKFGFNEKILSGLVFLKRVLSTVNTERSHDIMQHIQKLETESQHLVTNIVNTLTSKYNSVSPQEFHLQHRFSEELPDCEFTICQNNLRQIKLKTVKKDEQQGTRNDKANKDGAAFTYCFTRQTYLHTRHLNNNTLPDFSAASFETHAGCSAVPKGMIVKQKIATASSDVSFGWYKMHPWQQKKWTFFLKNSNTTLS